MPVIQTKRRTPCLSIALIMLCVLSEKRVVGRAQRASPAPRARRLGRLRTPRPRARLARSLATPWDGGLLGPPRTGRGPAPLLRGPVLALHASESAQWRQWRRLREPSHLSYRSRRSLRSPPPL